MKKVIPIVFSTDDNYSIYCYLAVFSMIKNASDEYRYEVSIMHSGLEESSIRRLESLNSEKASVKCIDISNYVRDVDLRDIIHLTVSTFYRLFIPEIFSNFEKVIYLDSDIIVNHDISDLYGYEMNGHALAAVRDVKCSYLEEHRKNIGIEDSSMLFNAGVLLVDVKRFQSERIKEKCLEALLLDYKSKGRKYVFADQDLLNVTLRGNIEFLPMCWNFQWQYMWRTESVFDDCIGQYLFESNDPKIIHYAGDKKPWSSPWLPKANIFWEIVVEAGLVFEVVSHSMRVEYNKKLELGCFANYRFPYEEIKPNSRVIIYGAGVVGKEFVEQLEHTLYAKKVCWIDRNYDSKPKKWEVKAPEFIWNNKIEYDYIIIAIDDKKIADEIRKNFKGKGITTQKIVWKEYQKILYKE